MKRFLMASALACILTASTFGGEIPSGGYAPPASEGTTQTLATPAPGDSPSGGYTAEFSTEVPLSILQTLISLLSV